MRNTSESLNALNNYEPLIERQTFISARVANKVSGERPSPRDEEYSLPPPHPLDEGKC